MLLERPLVKLTSQSPSMMLSGATNISSQKYLCLTKQNFAGMELKSAGSKPIPLSEVIKKGKQYVLRNTLRRKFQILLVLDLL